MKAPTLRPWWRSPTLVATASIIATGWFFVAWVFYQEITARFAAQRYCEEQGGVTINEIIPDDAILGILKPNGTPRLNEYGAIEPDGQDALTKLAAIDAYHLKKIAGSPHGIALAQILEERTIIDGSDSRFTRSAYVTPWDSNGPMIMAGKNSKYCKNSINIDNFPPDKSLFNKKRDLIKFRFCRIQKKDEVKIYIFFNFIASHANLKLYDSFVNFKGWRVYRIGALKPVATSTNVGIHSALSKLLIVDYMFAGNDPPYYHNMCYSPEYIESHWRYRVIGTPSVKFPYPPGRYMKKGPEFIR